MTRFLVHQLSTAHWFNIDAARRDLDYKPGISIDEGLRRLGRWFGSRISPDLGWPIRLASPRFDRRFGLRSMDDGSERSSPRAPRRPPDGRFEGLGRCAS